MPQVSAEIAYREKFLLFTASGVLAESSDEAGSLVFFALLEQLALPAARIFCAFFRRNGRLAIFFNVGLALETALLAFAADGAGRGALFLIFLGCSIFDFG